MPPSDVNKGGGFSRKSVANNELQLETAFERNCAKAQLPVCPHRFGLRAQSADAGPAGSFSILRGELPHVSNHWWLSRAYGQALLENPGFGLAWPNAGNA